MNNTQHLNSRIYDNLPEPIKNLTSLFEDRERDIVLLSCLGVLSGALPKVYGFYGRKKVYTNLYLMIVAPAGSGKSSMNYTRGLIEPIQKRAFCEKQNLDDKNKEDNTYVQTKIIPANTSTAELYNLLKHAHYGGIMIESEADTLSVMFKQDWGNFSDVLRRAFHHEPISLSRKKDKSFLEIDKPLLSLVLSGTPDQLKPLVQSKENGLFSRFLYYSFNEVSEWQDVFDYVEDFKDRFEEVGETLILPLYEVLFKNNEEIEFKFSEEQQSIFNSSMAEIDRIVREHHPEGFMANVRRHGLMLFRLSMILTVIRKYDEENLDLSELVICDDKDFQIAAEIVRELLRHALSIYNEMSGYILSQQEEDLLFSLKEIFTRKEIVEKALAIGIPERTIDDKLRQWREKRVIIKIAFGKYKRVLK